MLTGGAGSLADRFARHVTAAELFHPPGAVLVAVSGGPDSVALLMLLHATAPGLGLPLVVGHVDHGIHPDSADWAARVRSLAERLGVRCVTRAVALGPGGSETAARRARYAALDDMRRETGAAYVATAHHADDQRETVLFRALRGSGPAGLAGIPARGRRGVRRPLLPFGRRELADWLKGAHPELAPVRDPANADARHDRVWIRERLVPFLEERFPDVGRGLDAVARQALADRRAWDALLRSDAALGLVAGDGAAEVERAPFSGYDNALCDALLRALCRCAGAHLSARRAPVLRRFVRESPSGRSCELGGGWSAFTVFGRVRVARAVADRAPATEAVAWGTGERGETAWGQWGITWRRETAGRAVREGWTTWIAGESGEVRAPLRGDAIRPLGGHGRRPVRRLLMEARVSRADRAVYPVVVRGGTVLWIPGVCRAAEAVPRPGGDAIRLDVCRRDRP